MYYWIHDLIRNKYFEELKELSPYLRQAKLFQHLTEEMPLEIRKTDKIAGWYGYQKNEVIEPEERKHFAFHPVLNEKQRKLHKELVETARVYIGFTSAHTCIDYGTVLEKGLVHYLDMVEEALKEEPENDCLEAMKISILAACRYAERYALLAGDMAEAAEDTGEKAYLLRLKKALLRVPKYGADDFQQAVQSVWLMHSLVPMAEMSWASISLGRMDQYLYPFYRKHLQDGGTKEEAKEILKHLFVLLDSYGDGACALNLGGMTPDGKDLMNEFSKVLIEVEKEMKLRAPILAVRVNPNTPAEILDDLIDFELFKIGQPTFYGELACWEALKERGLSEKEASGFSANSCMGLIIAGREFADMWGIKFNAHLPLELAVNGKNPLNGALAFDFPEKAGVIDCFEDLLAHYEYYLGQLMGIYSPLHRDLCLEAEANIPDPFLSVLTEGCIEKRRDRAVGAVYNTVTVEMMGLINTIDALNAIRLLVFEQKKYTLAEFIKAAQSNFEGYENLHKDLLKCPKYGMNDAKVNEIGRRVCEMAYDACQKQNAENRLYLPSLHTIDVNVTYGMELYATLDGRKAGEPVNKNANPSLLVNKLEHTGQILSAAALGQHKFSGGQPIDVYFDKEWFGDKALRDKIKALILTYHELGGLQFQVNSIDIELLEKAHQEPEKYPHVIIRKGGFSVYFTELMKEVREDFLRSAKGVTKNG